MGEKTLRIKLGIVYLTIFGALACYYPFLAIYFADRGLSYSQIGVAFAINSLTAVVAQPVWGYLTDKYSGKRKTIALAAIGSTIAILMFMVSKSFLMVLLSIVFFMTLQSPVCSVTDAYCYEIIDHNKNLQYGRIRLHGSIGYAILALIVGAIIKKYGIHSSFIIYSVITAIGVLVLLSINFKSKHGSSTIRLKDISELLRNKKFMLFISSVAVANIALGANGNYLSFLIQKTGGDVSKLGILWFIVAMSELPVLFVGNKLIKKYGELNLYLLSLLIYVLRFFLDSIAPTYSFVLAIQVMQSITFSLYIICAMQYLNIIVPPKMRATGITLFSSIGAGFGGFIGNISGGILLEWISVFSLFRILGVVIFVAFALGLMLKKM